MTAEALRRNEPESVKFTTAVALTSGEVIQLPDGRAAVVAGLCGFAAGQEATVYVEGVYEVAKTSGIVLLPGGKAFWDRSASSATFRQQSGDFYIGSVYKDAASGDTTAWINLNVKPQYRINLREGAWNTAVTNGVGVTRLAGDGYALAFDGTAEAALAAVYSGDTVELADGPIWEARVAIFDIGDNAALDINFGLANGTHATDADQITESVLFHLDGSALDIKAESDDGTTEVAATDTTVDAVDDTYFEVWIDLRDPASAKLYIDGVRVLDGTTFDISAAAGPLLSLFHVEKTSDDTTAEVRVLDNTVRTTDLAA